MGKKLDYWDEQISQAADKLEDDPDDWGPMLSACYRWLVAERKRRREGKYAEMAGFLMATTITAMEETARKLCELHEAEAAGQPWPGGVAPPPI